MSNLIQETRPCSNCRYFQPRKENQVVISSPLCIKKNMWVTDDMLVSFKEEEGTCFEESFISYVSRYIKALDLDSLPLCGQITNQDARFELVRYWAVLNAIQDKIEEFK